jgi:hypothetical protein
MAFEPPIAVYDACVLYPFHLRNLLVQCAVDRVVEARWTDEIHDEWIGNLSANNPNVPVRRLRETRDLMNAVLPTATVADYQLIVPAIFLPDPGDRHVVAAAVAADASVIVTWNVRDFPVAELRKHGLKRETPDAFLAGLYELIPDVMIEVAARARRNLRTSRVSAREYMDALRRQRLIRFASKIERHLAGL